MPRSTQSPQATPPKARLRLTRTAPRRRLSRKSARISMPRSDGGGNPIGLVRRAPARRLRAVELDEDGEHRQRGDQAHRGADREEKAETEDALMACHEQAREAGHGGEPVQDPAQHGASREGGAATVAALHEAHVDVEAEL